MARRPARSTTLTPSARACNAPRELPSLEDYRPSGHCRACLVLCADAAGAYLPRLAGGGAPGEDLLPAEEAQRAGDHTGIGDDERQLAAALPQPLLHLGQEAQRVT